MSGGSHTGHIAAEKSARPHWQPFLLSMFQFARKTSITAYFTNPFITSPEVYFILMTIPNISMDAGLIQMEPVQLSRLF